jgi:alpha/beta superfamily hydrolase
VIREYPVFVPSGEEKIAAVIAVPEGTPRGLVLLLPGGGGAPRSQRYGMYTKVARSLAERGIASVRMEWRGIGESTGQARYSFNALPVEDTTTVARFALRATGATRFGMAGNCGGARTALLVLPDMPEARAAVLMMLKPRSITRSQKPPVKRMKRWVKRIPWAGALIRQAYWAVRGWRRGTPVYEGLRVLNGMSDLLLLEAGTVKVGKLPRLVGNLQVKNGRHRLELRTMPGGASRSFHSIERQHFVIESVIEWFDQLFPAMQDVPAHERSPRSNGQPVPSKKSVLAPEAEPTATG